MDRIYSHHPANRIHGAPTYGSLGRGAMDTSGKERLPQLHQTPATTFGVL